MLASELRKAMLQVGFLDEELDSLKAEEAKKIYIAKINSMVPEGSEDEPDIPEFLVEIYNRLDEEEIEGWRNPTRHVPERRKPFQAPKKPKERKDPSTYAKRGPKPKDRSKEPEKTETPRNYRGRAVKMNRLHCLVEAFKLGGTREEILIKADKIFVKNGGGSNYFQTTQAYMQVLSVLKQLKLLKHYDNNKMKIKEFKV